MLEYLAEWRYFFRKEGAAPKLKNMLLGRRVIGEMLIERIPMEAVPQDPTKAANWLHQLYRHKVSIHKGFRGNRKFAKFCLIGTG